MCDSLRTGPPSPGTSHIHICSVPRDNDTPTEVRRGAAWARAPVRALVAGRRGPQHQLRAIGGGAGHRWVATRPPAVTAAAVRACGRRKMTHVCKHVLMPRRPGETCGAPARAEPRPDTHTHTHTRAPSTLRLATRHPPLLWTYPGIRGQRARPVLCLIASALVFIWH